MNEHKQATITINPRSVLSGDAGCSTADDDRSSPRDVIIPIPRQRPFSMGMGRQAQARLIGNCNQCESEQHTNHEIAANFVEYLES